MPITVKACFATAGQTATVGNTPGHVSDRDALLVRRLKAAGAIVLGKTNLPQMMTWHECDNPVYGCTNNPWDLGRTPGGSTGGEAAIIAARGSPLGLGNDLGGSIRVPCHFCGIHGLKPTSFRLPNGLTVIINERPGLPIVAANLVLRTGSDANPSDKPGLANFTSAMLDEGTTTRSALQIADEVFQLGGTLGTGSSMDSIQVTAGSLRRTFPSMLDLVADIVRRPSFPAEEIER